MSELIIPAEVPVLRELRKSRLDGLARRLLFSLLRKLERGRITVVDDGVSETFGVRNERFPLEATITVHHSRFYGSALLGGSIGAAEAYMAGYWSADDLTTLIRIVLLNQEVFAGMDRGWSRLSAPLHKLFHFFRRNTKGGSRENIFAHYDLGNDFYSLFLDETLTYSCAIFPCGESTLAEASLAKYDRICRKLHLSPADHVLEIGTGWGGFAIHAARTCGCRVTTTTISRAQHDLAKERIREAGVADRVELLFEDYRDLKGGYDKLVSIEMIEAVGHQYLETFFQACGRLLKEDGMMALQAITIADHAFESHARSVDFIKRYIFPGSCIPSVAAMCGAVARATDLRLVHLEDITPHYARTLHSWRERFFANVDRVRALGYPESFIRMWEYYLCYCEGGFLERYLGDVQMLFVKPLWRGEAPLPALE
jgi:cyclopropane-fatty-acyl-phospholipid synthase